MSEVQPTKNRPYRKLKWAAHSLVYLMLLYVLAAGPLYWQIYEACLMDGSPVLRVLYYPLLLACEHSDYVSNFLHWYADLWVF